MEVTPILAFKMFVSAITFAGLLDMYIVQVLKGYSTRFKTEKFANQNLKWASALPAMRRIIGDPTLSYMKSRTLLFPAFEIAFGSLVVINLYRYGLSSSFIRTGVFLVIAMLAAMISWHEPSEFTAPKTITYPGTVIGLLISLIIGPADSMLPGALIWPVTTLISHSPNLANSLLHVLNSLLGALIGGGALWLMRWIWQKLRGIEGMSKGDVQAGMMIGAFCGWRLAILTLFLAVLTGSVYGIGLMLRSRTRDLDIRVRFSPFLVLGGIIAMLWGTGIVSWYTSQFNKK